MNKETSIIVLNYNNFLDTKECVESLLKISNTDFEIVVVDNNSSDGSGDELSCYFKDSITYLRSEVNVGYAAGNNVGIRYAKMHGAKYICILNNDTVVFSNFLEKGIDYLEKHMDVAFVAPVLLNYSDSRIQSVGGDINLWTGGCITRWSKSKSIRYIGKELFELNTDVVSDYVGGACMLFKSSLIDLIGYIPENYFLFFEETEWCVKANKLGLRSVCLHEWAIKHKGSASIDKCSGLHEYMLERNRVVFEKRNVKSKLQLLVFLIILCLKTTFLCIKDRNKKLYFKYYKDGLLEKIDKKYPYVYINNEG